MKKGLAVIEFIIALGIFIAAFLFLIFSITQRIPLLNEAKVYNDVVSESYEVSNLILFNSDYGVSNGTNYFIDKQKIDDINIRCGSNGGHDLLKNFRQNFSERILSDDGINKLIYFESHKLNNSNQWEHLGSCGNSSQIDDFSIKTIVERFEDFE